MDSSAWWFYFRRHRDRDGERMRVAEDVRRLVEVGAAWIHPVVAGEVCLGGVDPLSAFRGLPWIEVVSTDRDVVQWLAGLPRDVARGVGWADVRIVHTAAVELDMVLVTGDVGQRALYERVRRA